MREGRSCRPGARQQPQRLKLEDYSVSNRGLRAGLVGTPAQIAGRIAEFERAGVELLLLQFSPQLEEMERFAADVMGKLGGEPALPPPAAPVGSPAVYESARSGG